MEREEKSGLGLSSSDSEAHVGYMEAGSRDRSIDVGENRSELGSGACSRQASGSLAASGSLNLRLAGVTGSGVREGCAQYCGWGVEAHTNEMRFCSHSITKHIAC